MDFVIQKGEICHPDIEQIFEHGAYKG